MVHDHRPDSAAGAVANLAEPNFSRLLEAAPDAIVIVNAGGQIVLVNRQAELMFGYSRAELIGQVVEVLVPEEYRGVHEAHRAAYLASPCLRPMGAGRELNGRRRDGTTFPVEISLSPLDSGTEMLVTSIIRDVTERKETEDRLRRTADTLETLTKDLQRSNAELEQFAYVASHDLQEPLRMVASYTQLLRRRYQGKLDADADEFIGYAVDGATRMQRLINDLLVYSRVGRQQQLAESVDMERVFEQVVTDLAGSIEEANALVTRGELPVVVGDGVQLGQLLQNVIGNAIKFCQDRPRVHLAAERSGAEWVFSVEDNGIGIDPEYAERIFVIFQRLHSRDEYPGTGIGLAISKKIVERHGGRIWLKSEPNHGSTFIFTLPAREVERSA